MFQTPHHPRSPPLDSLCPILHSPVWSHPTLCQHLMVSQLRAGACSFLREWKQQAAKRESASASPASVRPCRAGTPLKGLWAPKASLHRVEILGLTVSIWGSLKRRNRGQGRSWVQNTSQLLLVNC